jgi:methoxymalonate biosynthesis acyl carrier protein
MTTSPSRTAGHSDSIATELVAFLEDRLKMPIAPDGDLFASGGVSSLFAMELVVHLERSYGIAVVGRDLAMANFRTVEAMTALVLRLRESGDPPA